MRVGLDLDGCVYDFERATTEALRSRGYDLGPWDSWDYVKENIDPADWRWVWESKEGLEGAFGQIDYTYEGAIDAVREISKLVDLAIITHRPRRVAATTAAFLARHNVVFDSLHIQGPRQMKSDILPHADVYIEDKAENVMDFHRNTAARQIWMPIRGWNEQLHDGTEDGRVRAFETWSAPVRAIRRLAADERRRKRRANRS